MDLPWQAAVDIVQPHVVKIMTPRGSGTGSLLFSSKAKGFCAVATAAHVVNAAHFWEEPIRLQHIASQSTELFRAADRSILLNASRDVAAIVFRRRDGLPLPEESHDLSPAINTFVLVLRSAGLDSRPYRPNCASLRAEFLRIWSLTAGTLIDGVAINGVSGGPAFLVNDKSVALIGVVSAYVPNRATGEILPGLAVVTDVAEFHKMVHSFKNFEEALSEQTSPTEAPVVPPTEPVTPGSRGSDGAV